MSENFTGRDDPALTVARPPGAGGWKPPKSQMTSIVAVSVADSGIGIDPRDHLRVFNEFEQLDSSYARQQPGTGLGLALTRRLV